MKVDNKKKLTIILVGAVNGLRHKSINFSKKLEFSANFWIKKNFG